MMRETMRSGGRRWLVAAVLMTVAGCSHGSKKDEEKAGDTRCPESRNLTCVAGTDCTVDRERGCETCQCSRGDALSPTDQRVPESMRPRSF
ncbi:hypothetical protein [Pyxidicoccus xibeiensis]|uniref:hypothetical protein n=1 Tax=Pyxidicoccus xibeiensis TaxID=2906759 RepID=UPI0020A81C72|nr:hypothetical protein [Pyxidicoccus xibeiensis]MCP3136436.1 hypothetical protein [Pyxidicoccus xibeiensis]